MKNFLKLTAVASILILASCNKIDASKGVSKDHNVSLNGFTGIELGISGSLEFEESATTNIIVNTTDKAFNGLDIYLENNILHVEVKDGYAISNASEIKTTINAPDVNSLTVTGSGNLSATFDSTIVKSTLRLTNTGSGKLTAEYLTTESAEMNLSGSGAVFCHDLNTENSNATITGSGSLKLSGTCNNSIMELSGSGLYQGFDFQTNTVDAVINGSGSCQVKANTSINATLSGSGSLLYKGDPSISSAISGSGTIIDAN